MNIIEYAKFKKMVGGGSGIEQGAFGKFISGDITEITAEDLNGATKIADYALKNHSYLSAITIPGSVVSIGQQAFYCCSNLVSATILEGVQTIGENAFADCEGLSSVVLPDSLTSIGGYAFSYTSISNITIPQNVETIGIRAFQYTSIVDVEIPKKVTVIASYVFQNCSALESVVVNGAVTEIGASAFNNCKAVKYYDFTKCTAVPTCGTNAFYNIPSTCEIRVPSALYDEWIAATNWSNYASNIVKV